MAKAVLVAFRMTAPRIHDLEKLGEVVVGVHPAVGASILDLAVVTTWYVTARYPEQDDGLPSAHDIQSTLPNLRALRRQIGSLAPPE